MVLVFDSGTTNTKAFLFNEKGELIACASHPTRIMHRSAGMVEQKAEYWWSAIVESARKLRAAVDWRREDVEAIGISSQGGTFVPLGKKMQPLRPGITWLDNRGASISERLNRTYGSDYFFSKTGHYLAGWSPPSICLWLKETEPQVFSRMERLSFVADYLNYRLTGKFFLDGSSAGMTCFYNIVKGRWDEEILKTAEISGEQMPLLVPADSPGGSVTEEAAEALNVPAGIPVVAGGHDQYCASLGAGAINRGDCLLSCGTAWALLVMTDEPVFIPGSGWFPGRHLRENTFGLMASLGNGGVVLDWVRKNFRIKDKTKEINQSPSPGKCSMEEFGVKKSHVAVIPDFMEEKGAITNISLADTGSEIYFAAMKSLALRLKERLDRIRDRIEVKRLLMVGGGTKEKMLPPMVENETGIEVVLPGIIEAAGRGAAMLAIQKQ